MTLALALLAGGTGAVAMVAAPVGAPATPDPPLGRAVEPPLPLPALQPNPGRLAEACSILAARVHAASAAAAAAAAGCTGSTGSAGFDTREDLERTLGGYLFLTDLREPALLARAAAVVGSLEAIYFERYGRQPIGTPREAIVLFSREEDYRRFQAGDPRLAGLTGSTGFAGSGVVATFRGERSDDELLGTLVHELGHLLNRRAIGPSLPSWLDEGIADDLGASRIDAFGTLVPGSWSRTLDVRGREIRISGGEAALRDLAEVFGPDGRSPGRLDLGAMLALEWEDFVAPHNAELHYAAAAAFIRMLLAAPAKSAVFRGWLAQVSAGGAPAAEELRRALGRPWDELEPELGLWTRGELARLPPLRQAGVQVARPRATLSAFSTAE